MEEVQQDQDQIENIEEQKQNKDSSKNKHTKKNKNQSYSKNKKSSSKFGEISLEDSSQKIQIQPHKVDTEYIKKADLSQISKIFCSEKEEVIIEGVTYLKAFIQESKPTFILLFDILDHFFFQEQELLEKSSLNMFKILKSFSSQNANSIIYKTYFALIQHYSVKVPTENQEFYNTIPLAWKFIHLDSLSTFLQIFDLKQEIKLNDVDEEVKNYIAQKKYLEAVKVISNFENYADSLLPQIIELLCTNKDASKAADLIKQFKLNPSHFPDVEIRLKKMNLRYNLRSFSWEFVAELFKEHNDILAYAVEDLIFNKQYNQAYSILKSDKDILKYITKKEVLEVLNDTSINLQVLPNILYQKDSFNPTSENSGTEPVGTHMNLKDFGIKREQVFFIDDVNSKEFAIAKQELQNAKQIGLDGEFKPPLTKLDNTSQSLALLQIASQNYCFLFDSITLKDKPEYLQLLKSIFENQNIIKIGHTISGDISMVAQQLNGLLNVKCILDLAKVHKAKYPEQKQSSLSFIAKFMLNKALCKAEQTSNWSQRPLREAQIHYGAMDAYISIALYNKYIEVIGEEELQKFIERL